MGVPRPALWPENEFIHEFNEFCKERGLERRQWKQDMWQAAFEIKGLTMVDGEDWTDPRDNQTKKCKCIRGIQHKM